MVTPTAAAVVAGQGVVTVTAHLVPHPLAMVLTAAVLVLVVTGVLTLMVLLE